jgi:hypothetical protein
MVAHVAALKATSELDGAIPPTNHELCHMRLNELKAHGGARRQVPNSMLRSAPTCGLRTVRVFDKIVYTRGEDAIGVHSRVPLVCTRGCHWFPRLLA